MSVDDWIGPNAPYWAALLTLALLIIRDQIARAKSGELPKDDGRGERIARLEEQNEALFRRLDKQEGRIETLERQVIELMVRFGK